MKDDDFGFTTQQETAIAQDLRMKRVEQLVFPLIENLIKTSDTPTIHWPNRKPLLEKLLSDLKEITRNE